jgi:hypothetical protein
LLSLGEEKPKVWLMHQICAWTHKGRGSNTRLLVAPRLANPAGLRKRRARPVPTRASLPEQHHNPRMRSGPIPLPPARRKTPSRLHHGGRRGLRCFLRGLTRRELRQPLGCQVLRLGVEAACRVQFRPSGNRPVRSRVGKLPGSGCGEPGRRIGCCPTGSRWASPRARPHQTPRRQQPQAPSPLACASRSAARVPPSARGKDCLECATRFLIDSSAEACSRPIRLGDSSRKHPLNVWGCIGLRHRGRASACWCLTKCVGSGRRASPSMILAPRPYWPKAERGCRPAP